MNPIHVALIGLGNNSANYYLGLMKSSTLRLLAVCDPRENASSRELFASFPYYQDYRELVGIQELSAVFIVTPPETHYEIAKFFLSHHIAVLLEKPPVAKLPELASLRGTANRNRTQLATVFHWQFGPEILFLKSILPNLGPLLEAHTTIFDPYCSGSEILPQKAPLGGCWMDSGSNALSVYNYLFPSLKPVLIDQKLKRDPKFAIPFFADVSFQGSQNALFRITTDWRGNRDQKDSVYLFTNGKVVINHTAQTLVVNGETHTFDQAPRLSNHYLHLLRDFSFSLFQTHRMNRQTLAFLYEVNEQ